MLTKQTITKTVRQDRKAQIRRLSAQFPRLIEWSEEDGSFVGSAPPLVSQCCHGKTEAAVATQLAVIVDDLVQDVLDGKMAAPKAEPGKTYSGKFVVRIPMALHKKIALKAQARGESLNQYVAEVLTQT
jgi:predicted HicB family RNase H-like nuclease